MSQVQDELRQGRKVSHWMWFVFPQLRGLGHSETAKFYGIASRAEADAYLRHPVLGSRLIACTTLVNQQERRTAHDIFGSPDDLKFRSCMTLFSSLDDAPPVFAAALAKFFAATPDARTLELLAGDANTGSS